MRYLISYCCEANVKVIFVFNANVGCAFDFNLRVQLLFPFGSFDRYFPDYLTFSCCSKISELTAVLWTGLTSFNLGLGLLEG